MHLKALFRDNSFVTILRDGTAHGEYGRDSVSADIFERGLCLPSDIKMTKEEQDVIIEIIRSFF